MISSSVSWRLQQAKVCEKECAAPERVKTKKIRSDVYNHFQTAEVFTSCHHGSDSLDEYVTFLL